MSFNIAEATKDLISNNLINKASTFFGESGTGISKTVSGVLPVILGGLIDRSSTVEGAATVAKMSTTQYQSGVLDNLSNFFERDSEPALAHGAGLVNTIFEDKVSSLAGILSNFAGVKTTTAAALLSMVTPVVLAFLGKNTSTNNLNAAGLATMLHNQKNNISNAIPAGLNLASIFDSAPIAVNKPTMVTAPAEEATSGEAGNGLKFLLPLLLLVLIAAAAWYLVGDHTTTTATKAATADSSAVEKK